MRTEMESNVTLNIKQSFLPEHNRLKKFTIPKRIPDKDFLSDCSTNQRDYHEIKERLNQGCFDRECDLGSLCHFDKIEMVHNKDLEEEFVAKRAKMREQGRMDKELSSFLVVSKDEVLKICQSGLCTSNSIKKGLDIMKELGNPQLGVYLFRHVDIALNYASKHSIQIEYIIIFRVLLGKVKKIQPPKGKKKVVLDPTPNYDCHVSRIHPSLKDSIEDQAIGSLVYFYEYSELSKPVDRPRQCLPHAVVKVRVKQKVRADHPVISLKFGPKRFSKGRGRGQLLENCTVVTRIGNSKLIYEHFHKPKNSAVSDNVSVEVSSLSESVANWNCSGTETQGSKIKQKLPGRWDSAQVETDVWNFKCMPDVECNGDAIKNHVGSCSKNPNDASVSGELSTTITSKLIKDPRLMKKGKNPQEQNGETTSHGIQQCENELKYQIEMKTSASLSIPWLDPEELFLLNNSRHMVSREQCMSKTQWKDRVSGEHQSSLNSNLECLVDNEHAVVNLNQLNREEMYSQFQEDDGCSSEVQCSASLDSKCSKNHCISKRGDEMLQSRVQKRMHFPESSMRDICTEENNVYEWSAGDQMHAGIFEQNKLQEMTHFEKYTMNGIPEKNHWLVLSSSEKASNSVGEMEENTSKKLEGCIDNVKDWVDISHILDSENSAFDFNLDFQDKCSLTESQLKEIESHKDKLSDLSDPALLTKFTGPTTEDTALMLLTSSHVLLECVTDSQFENSSHSKNEDLGALNSSSMLHNSMPERFEQELAVECTDINTPDLEVKSETEILSEGYKKCALIPQNVYSHTEMSPEEGDYQYLKERIAWENLLAKPSSDTAISRWTSLKKDKNACLCEGKIDERGKATEMFKTYVRPDLQITVANVLYPHQSSLKMRTGMEKLVTKCSEQKKGIKWSLEGKNEKYKVDQKNPRIYHQKKVLNTQCSSEMNLPFSKGQPETFEQSEKHIKNILHTLNTEASLCKNKYLSRKINGAMFHLKKAQRSVQKYLKILARTAKKKRNTNSRKIVLNNLLKSSVRASYNAMSVPEAAACFAEQESPTISMLSSPIDMKEAGEKTNSRLESLIESKGDRVYNATSFFNNSDSHSGGLHSSGSVTSAFIADMPHSRDNTRVRAIEHELSEKSTSSDTMELGDTKPTSNESTVNSEQTAYTNVVSENTIQEILSPVMGCAKQELTSKTNKNIVTSKNIAKLSICHSDLGADADVCESYVRMSTVRLATPVEKSLGKLKPSNLGATSKLLPIFNRKDTSSVEKEAGEISPAQQNTISMHVDRTQACDLSQTLVPVVKSRHAARDAQVLLTPQIHGSGCRTKTNNYSERNLNKICSEKQAERQGLYENKKFKSLVKPVIQPENNIKGPNGHLKQTSQVRHKKESANQQTSPVGHEKYHSVLPLREQGGITATMISSCAHDNVLSKDKSLSSKHSNNCKNVTSETKLPVEVEQTALGFIMQMSEILQIADKTSCLNVLQEQVRVCKNVLPLFIRALEEKQECSFEHVLVSRENAEKSMRAKLKPCAIESLVDLQIITETIEFLENKRKYLQGKPTFRSLLWFDDSLCIELFGGRSGYQQQSNLYPTFQRGLKYNALNELQSHQKKLVEKYEITRLENKSYYCLLKLRREIKECEAAVRSNSLLSDFFYSEPYVCGANYGDTVEDLENARKSTVGLINTCRSLSGIPLGPEKIEHLEIIMNIISRKIELIRAHEEGNIKSSFIGLEHIFFNAAVSIVLREKSIWEGEMLQIYEAALPKLYEIYEDRVEKLENILTVEKPYNDKKVDGGANYDIKNYFIGEILEKALSVNVDRLREYQIKCIEQLEVLKKYFQIFQEEDVDHVLITEENVLSFMESSGLRAIRLKPEAVEVYTDLAMVHETLFFIQNSIARKEEKPTFRSLLWCDLELVKELFHCQQNMASFNYRNDDLLESIESAISDLQDELNVVMDYSKSYNSLYARRLLTRELEELLETRKYLQMSASSVCMCIDVVPYSIALNYGSTIPELEYNYEQFYSLLEKLLLEEKKDLGKMAQVLKILKTIEHMKFICMKQEKPPLHLVICQMLKNWRKSRGLKKRAVTKGMDANGSSSVKHKRPAGLTSEDNSFDHERKNDSSDSKKKKVFASLTTTEKKQEEETCRNMRKDERPKAFEREELQLRISTDDTWNKKDECLRDRPSLSPSYSEGLKVADPLDCAEFSSSVSSPALINSNTSDRQKNPTDLIDLNKNWKGCSKENNQECFPSCDKRGKVISESPNKDPSPQNSPEDCFTSIAELSGDSSELLLDEYCDLKQGAMGNASSLIPNGCAAIPLELDSEEMYEKKSAANHETTYNSDSSAIPELNKLMELESSCSDPFVTENTQPPMQCSSFNPNERIEEMPHIHSYSVYTYRTVYPPSSWHFYQAGSSCHQVTQTYQEFSSYEMHQLTPTMLTTTSMVYNTQSSTFYSQSYSHFGVGESQRFNFVQTYPVHSYFNSTVSFPYSCQQWPSWYAESHAQAYPYSSNIGL